MKQKYYILHDDKAIWQQKDDIIIDLEYITTMAIQLAESETPAKQGGIIVKK